MRGHFLRAVNRPWTPAQLGSDLALWLDADDASTVTLNGSTVSQWSDRSGNGRNITQSAAANQPAYVTGQLNAKPIIRTDGISDFLVNASTVSRTVTFQSRTTLPDGALGSIPGKGWTCTGLFYDSIENVWWVSNDGRANLGSSFFPSIVKMDFNATTILDQIDIKAIYPDNTTIQGLVIDPQNNSIWFAALGQNKLRNITKAGVSLGELSFTSPNGLAYDTLDDTLIVHDGSAISVVNKTTGAIIRTYEASHSSADHLYFDPLTRYLYISYGNNGSAGNIEVYNHDSGMSIENIGPFAEVTATEGIWIIDNNIYFLSDAYFHPEGPVDLNQILNYTFEPLPAGLGSSVSSYISAFSVGKARTTDTTARGWYYAGAGPINSPGWGVYPLLGDQSIRVIVNGGSAVVNNTSVNGNATTNYAITSLLINRLEQFASFAVNGGTGIPFATTGSDTLPLVDNFTLGKGDASGRRSASDTAEIVITNSNISTADRQKLEGYLAHKWGLTAGLPNDHPYKTAAPTV
jgi:hypothetical protein